MDDRSGEQDVLDRERLGKLRILGPEGARLLAQLIDVALSDTPGRLQRMRDAVQRADTADARGVAHSLRARFGMLGALGLEESCRELEEAPADADLDDLALRIDQQFAVVAEALRSERDRLTR